MGLFSQEAEGGSSDAPQRTGLTRERGTRNLVVGFVIVIAIWFLLGKIWDFFLLQRVWPTLTPDSNGLTVVGTLDGRGSYDQNMFRIINANQTSRVELTDQGWRRVFNPSIGGLCTDEVGKTIRATLSLDGEAGYAMLEPFLRYGVALEQHLPNPGSAPTNDTPIVIHRITNHGSQVTQEKLGVLIQRFRENAASADGDAVDKEAGMHGGNDREVDHGLTIPADTLSRVCPTVLSGRQFTSADIETEPASIVQKETYTVGLNLTPEGRSRFFHWSHDHAHESVVFIVNGHIDAAARVNEPMDVNYWEISPLLDGTAAQELVAFVKSHRR